MENRLLKNFKVLFTGLLVSFFMFSCIPHISYGQNKFYKKSFSEICSCKKIVCIYYNHDNKWIIHYPGNARILADYEFAIGSITWAVGMKRTLFYALVIDGYSIIIYSFDHGIRQCGECQGTETVLCLNDLLFHSTSNFKSRIWDSTRIRWHEMIQWNSPKEREIFEDNLKNHIKLQGKIFR